MLTYKILLKLREETVLTSKEIAKDLKTSISKVRNEMLFIESVISKNGAEIVKKRGRGNGYVLSVREPEKFLRYLNQLEEDERKDEHQMSHPISRIETLCHRLLNSSGPIKSEDLAFELMISGRQLNNDLHVVREFLKDYSLELKNRPYYGMEIVGEEFNKRLCLANLYMKNFGFNKLKEQQLFLDNAENDRVIKKIKNIIQEESENFNIRFSDVALMNLVIHLFIIIKRSPTNQLEKIKELNYVSEQEKEITEKIVMRMTQEFSITLSKFDFQYIVIHIAGKRAYLDDEISIIPNESKDLANDLLLLIDDVYKTNFSNDENLTLRLQLHIAPLLIRIKNGISSKNPLTNEIKTKYAMSYEISLLIGNEIENRYGVRLVDDELAYFAVHFELSLYQTKLKKYKVLLVCHTGTCSSEILKQQIQGKFYNYISQLDTCAVNQINHYNLEEYTFIFSTVNINVFTKTPIYIINDFLDDKSTHFINKVFERGDFSEELTMKFFPEELFMGVISAETKEEVIKLMVNHIKEVRKVPDDFYQNVMERELASPTDYGNSVAIPHPIKMGIDGNTFSCVGILKKPIKWENNIVKVVFLNNISKGGKNLQNYYYLLSKLITNEDNIESLIKNPAYENMINIINGKG